MNFDLEIISEEGDCPDPLFNSIMNAMNSMKEATADKIYQKIQREGETNYSKPQVDRALANALKYGIFEVRNNRYRVRDDILDDEDTVYSKLQKSRGQTPFRIQEDINERQFGPKLDPERDNKRFRRLCDITSKECSQCGRTKKPETDQKEPRKDKLGKKSKKFQKNARQKKKISEKRHRKFEYDGLIDTNVVSKKLEAKRKMRSDSISEEEKRLKVRRLNGQKNPTEVPTPEAKYFKEKPPGKNTNKFGEDLPRETGKYDSTDESELDSISWRSDDDQNFSCYMPGHSKKPHNQILPYKSESDGVHRPDRVVQARRSSVSLKSGSESDTIGHSTTSDNHSTSIIGEEFFESLPCTSKHEETKETSGRNQCLGSSEIYTKQCGRGRVEDCSRKSDWMGYSDEPQGTIIQSNNVLTIEPMDSLVFTNPEQTSYIS